MGGWGGGGVAGVGGMVTFIATARRAGWGVGEPPAALDHH